MSIELLADPPDPSPEPRVQVFTRHCEMAGCENYQATEFSACGTFYLCPDCRATVKRMSAELREDEAE
jgi:hypothetical protein